MPVPVHDPIAREQSVGRLLRILTASGSPRRIKLTWTDGADLPSGLTSRMRSILYHESNRAHGRSPGHQVRGNHKLGRGTRTAENSDSCPARLRASSRARLNRRCQPRGATTSSVASSRRGSSEAEITASCTLRTVMAAELPPASARIARRPASPIRWPSAARRSVTPSV